MSDPAPHTGQTTIHEQAGTITIGYSAGGALVIRQSTPQSTEAGVVTETTLTIAAARHKRLILALLLDRTERSPAISSFVMDIAKANGIPYQFRSY